MNEVGVWVAALIAIAFLGLLELMRRRAPPIMPPYRKAVRRERRADGDAIELECGHYILLRHHHTSEFPCEECAEEARAIAEKTK